MTAPIAYGIDFGTTNSLLSIAYPDRIELARVEQSVVVPSVTYLHRIGRYSAGRDAVSEYMVTGSAMTRCGDCDLVDRVPGAVFTDCQQHAPGGLCHDARLISSLKSVLTGKREQTHSWGKDFNFSGLIARILERLKREADALTGTTVGRAVIGHPVVYPDAQGPDYVAKQRLALTRMKEAAHAAGFHEVVFLEEPAAALLGEQAEGLLVAVDFGGGTFDVGVMEMADGSGIALGLQGVAVGGEDFDAALFEAKLANHLEIPRALPAYLRESLRNLSGALFAIGRRELRHELLANGREPLIARILYGGFAYHFYAAIEAAKVALSSEDQATIDFHRPGIDIRVPVTRQEFEALIAPDLDAVFHQIESALRQAGVAPHEVTLVARTGGSSSIPAFIDGLVSIFGPERVEKRDAYATIVRGLGTHAQEIWR